MLRAVVQRMPRWLEDCLLLRSVIFVTKVSLHSLFPSYGNFRRVHTHNCLHLRDDKMRASDLFSLERQYIFYKAYHSNTMNRRIHIVFVPIIVISLLCLLSIISLPSPAHDMSRVVTLMYIVYCIVLNPGIGVAFTPFLLLYYAASRAFCDYAGPHATFPWALAFHFIGWFAQFIGHFAFEGKSPALFDSLLQSLLAAPVVTWLDIVFSCGLLPDFKARLLRSRVVAKARKAVAKN